MIYCFFADGFEEMEAISPVDILRRAGLEVITVGVGEEIISGAHGVNICTDITDNEIELSDELEMIILPGGMPGTLNLERNKNVQRAIAFCAEKNKNIAAICAAPSILGHLGLLHDREAICFPGFEEQLSCEMLSSKSVCRDGNIITAKSAGVAQEFGLTLCAVLLGEAKSEAIRASLHTK